MKKLITILLAITMLMSVAACGGEGGGGGGDNPTDYTELTGNVKFFLPGIEPNNMDDVTAAINAALKADGRNYTVSFTFEPFSSYWTKAPLMSSDHDAMWIHSSRLPEYVNNQVLLELDGYLANFGSKITSEIDSMYLTTAKVDGKLMAIPRVEPLSAVETPLTIRKDWMEEFEIDSISALSELELYFSKAYTKLSDVEGNAYVLDKDHSDFLRREYCPDYYFPLGNFSCYPIYIDLANKEGGKYVVKNFYESDAFKSMANKAREYYEAGYRADSRTALDSTTVDNAFNNGLLAAIWSSPTKISERIDAFTQTCPDGEMIDVILNPEADRWITKGGNMLGVYKKKRGEPKAAHVLDFYNWILSDREHSDLVCYGIKDVNYKLTADGRLSFDGITDNYSASFPSFIFNNLSNIRYSEIMTDAQIEQMTNWDKGDNVKVSPLIGFNPTLSGKANTAYSLISAAEKGYCEDFMYGSKSLDNDYATFMNSINAKLGDKTYMEILIADVQAQLDEYLGQ